MILRRVIEHFRKQEWTAIAIDFVIVVMGVFIGIQLGNWNAARAEKNLSQTYSAQIASDLIELQRQFEIRVEYYEEARKFGERAAKALASEEPFTDESAWSFILALFQAGQFFSLDIVSNSYEEARSVGVIRLIANEDVRSDLDVYFGLSASNIKLVDNALPRYRSFIRRQLPWAVQQPIWAGDCEVSATGDDLYQTLTLAECEPPADVPPELLISVADELKNNPEVAKELNGRLAELTVIDRDYRNFAARAGRLAGLLSDEQ